MSWNHRVVRRTDGTESVSFQIHEVYYNDHGGIESWTESPVVPFGETLEELRAELKLFMAALDKAVLVESNDGEALLEEAVGD